MENDQSMARPVSNTAVSGFSKLPSSVSLSIAVLLFFLPFLDIKCNNISIQKISGIELATGFQIRTPGTDNSLPGNVEKNTGTKGEKKDPYVYALVALALGVAGLLLSFLNSKVGAFGGIVTGVCAAGAMIGMMIDVKQDIRGEGLGTEDGVRVAVEFTPWFYVSLVAFLVAAFFSFRRGQPVKGT